MYELVYTEDFLKKLKKLIKKNKSLYPKIEKTIIQLEKDPFYPSLKLHKLKGELKEYYSVSINMSYRIILDLVIKENEIILLNIGNHDEVY